MSCLPPLSGLPSHTSTVTSLLNEKIGRTIRSLPSVPKSTLSKLNQLRVSSVNTPPKKLNLTGAKLAEHLQASISSYGLRVAFPIPLTVNSNSLITSGYSCPFDAVQVRRKEPSLAAVTTACSPSFGFVTETSAQSLFTPSSIIGVQTSVLLVASAG